LEVVEHERRLTRREARRDLAREGVDLVAELLALGRRGRTRRHDVQEHAGDPLRRGVRAAVGREERADARADRLGRVGVRGS